MKLAARYAFFAVIATLVNLLTQELVVQLYTESDSLILSLLAGTATGLVTKYLLDKHYIFEYQTRNIGHESRAFTLYSIMGLATTAVFWGFEIGFDYLFDSRAWRYIGGAIGLAIGYWLKYNLDKRFVFIHPER